MLSRLGLSTGQILDVFSEEIIARTGKVTDTFNDGKRLFSRAVLPQMGEVRPGDTVQGGVSLKATEEEVCLYPYIFRQVCTNGAIAAQTLESRCVADSDSWEPDLVLHAVREGVEACTEELFKNNVVLMQAASVVPADLVHTLLPLVSQFPRHQSAELLSQVMDRFLSDGDQSRFGLANAITSLARDTRDPALKWDLEELGGRVAVGAVSERPPSSGRSRAAQARRMVAVG